MDGNRSVFIWQFICNVCRYETIRSFAFPLILGSCFIPFFFIIAVLIEYEIFFKRFEIFIKNRKLFCYAKKRSKKYYKLNYRLIHSDIQRIMQGLCVGITKEEINDLFS